MVANGVMIFIYMKKSKEYIKWLSKGNVLYILWRVWINDTNYYEHDC